MTFASGFVGSTSRRSCSTRRVWSYGTDTTRSTPLSESAPVKKRRRTVAGRVVFRTWTLRRMPSLRDGALGPDCEAQMAGAMVSNNPCAGAGVSRGHITGSNEPATKRSDGLTTREGQNLAGRHDHRWSCSGRMNPIGRATGSDHRGRERVLRHSARTARNRRTRTRMYGGVGGGRGNSPADPIMPHKCFRKAKAAMAETPM